MQFQTVPWIFAIAYMFAAAGCGNHGASRSADGKWLEAPAALAIYLANTDLIMSGRDKEGCPVVIEEVRKGLTDPAMYGTRALLKQCSDAGMEFGEAVRCKDKRLQVRCLQGDSG